MKPLIGLTSEFVPQSLAGRPWHAHYLLVDYTSAVRDAGGIPIMLPLAHPDVGPELAARIDGIILTGGREDIPPDSYHQVPHETTVAMPAARWESEKAWLEYGVASKTPILGICLGLQVINVAFGGTLVQDIPTQRPGASKHTDLTRMYRHEVRLLKGSWLESVAPDSQVIITSAHHQAIDALAPGLVPVAHSDDGIIEGVEAPGRGVWAAVQWHPERNLVQPDWLIEGFVRHCAQNVLARSGPRNLDRIID